MLSSILSIRRRTLDDGSASDRVEFVFSTINIPRRLSFASVAFDLTPVIPPPKRCFSCQRFTHISEQCRSTHTTCEYCSEEHPSRDCPNTRMTPRCANCGDRHPTYSRDCPIYTYEFAVMKERTLKNCGYEEAENFLLSRGISKPLFSVEAWRTGQDFPLILVKGSLRYTRLGMSYLLRTWWPKSSSTCPPPCICIYIDVPKRGGDGSIVVVRFRLISFYLLHVRFNCFRLHFPEHFRTSFIGSLGYLTASVD